MSMFSIIVGVVLPPITFVIFVAAVGARLWTWRKLPQPGMTLFPTRPNGTPLAVVKETLLFPSLFKGDRALWLMSWLFHTMLALIVVGHIRVVTDFPALWAALHINPDTMSAVIGGAAGVMITIMAAALLFRRALVARVREISGVGDYFAMILILLIVVTGNGLRFGGHFDLETTRLYFSGLLGFSAAAVPANPLFLTHFLFAQLLLIYIPFSKIMHFGGVFFTQAALKRS